VLSACHLTGVAVWKLTPDLKEVKAVGLFQGQLGTINTIDVSPDNGLVASGGSDKTVRIWSLGTQGDYHRFEGHTGPVNTVVFTPDRRYVLSAGDDGTVRKWRVGHTR
jgi:WD40 repeat protein